MTGFAEPVLSIIIPAYNEQTTLKWLVDYVNSVSYPVPHEVIIIDDASTDRTYEDSLALQRGAVSTATRITVLHNPVNRGKGYSVRRGIGEAKGSVIVVQDADTEYDPHELPRLIQPVLSGEEQVVFGSRFMSGGYPKGMGLPNYIANVSLTWLTNLLYGLKLTDMETCYKIFRADIIKKMDLKCERFSFEPEVTALLTKSGVRIKEMPISYRGRGIKQGKKIRAIDFFKALTVLFMNRFGRDA